MYTEQMEKKNILELYSDYLLTSFGQTTSTGLSNLLEGDISHDQVTRFLSEKQYSSKDLWREVKRSVREMESDDGVLIFDDTIQEKSHSKENDLICWHYDHNLNRSVKGINLLNCLYSSNNIDIPVCYQLIEKILQCNIKTQKACRKSDQTKNEMLRNMIGTCIHNRLKFKYVLFDSWFSSKDNMKFIHTTHKKHFIGVMKTNRLIALSEEDRAEGRFVRIDSLTWTEHPVEGWIKGLDFPVLFHRQIFKNKDGSTGILYLVCSDLTATKESIETIYKKRWKVEVFHKTLKSNANLAKSPTKIVKTQSNHIFMAIYASFKLNRLSIKFKMNPFALKSKLYLKAIQQAFKELQTLKNATA